MYSMDLSGPPRSEVWAGWLRGGMTQAFLHSPASRPDTLTPADPTSHLCNHYISQRLPRGTKQSREHPQVNANTIDLSSLGTGEDKMEKIINYSVYLSEQQWYLSCSHFGPSWPWCTSGLVFLTVFYKYLMTDKRVENCKCLTGKTLCISHQWCQIH